MMPMTASMISAMRPILRVIGHEVPICSPTDTPLKVVPKSPTIRLPRYLKYWSSSGSLRLSFWLISAM